MEPAAAAARNQTLATEAMLRQLRDIAIVAAACFFLAITSGHIYFAAVFAAQAVAAAVLAVRFAKTPD